MSTLTLTLSPAATLLTPLPCIWLDEKSVRELAVFLGRLVTEEKLELVGGMYSRVRKGSKR